MTRMSKKKIVKSSTAKRKFEKTLAKVFFPSVPKSQESVLSKKPTFRSRPSDG